MGKNKNTLKLTPSSLFSFKQPWQWPSCNHHPRTLSFRDDSMFKTVNSVFFEAEVQMAADSCFTNSSESASMSTESEEYLFSINEGSEYPSVETIIRGARSERLLFEPGSASSSSILEEKETVCGKKYTAEDGGGGGGGIPYEESVAVAMESEDPYGDFRESMAEMVESHGLKDWGRLEELLGWYLKMNGKNNHGFIIEAFVDLVAGISDGDGGGGGGASCSDHAGASFVSAASSLSEVSEEKMTKEEKKVMDS